MRGASGADYVQTEDAMSKVWGRLMENGEGYLPSQMAECL